MLITEEISRSNARRSLVASKFIPAGKIIDSKDLTWKRPAKGIDPRAFDQVIGMKAINDIEEDTVLKWGLLDN
jgi:N-acetylneuraminate synthase